MPLSQALTVARERGVDLVEVAPTAVPPVCRVLDYGKFRYEQAKKEREARRSQKTVAVRQVRMRPRIDPHDIEVKVMQVKKLLEEGDKVKVQIIFRGRENAHPDIGRAVLAKLSEALEGHAVAESPPIMEGNSIHLMLSPAPTRTKASKEV